MANSKAGEVALEVDGKAFLLKATHNSMATAEDMLGRSIFDVNGGGVRFVRALLLSMIAGQHDVHTLDQAGALIDADPLGVTKAVNEATSLFFRLYQPKEAAAATVSAGKT